MWIELDLDLSFSAALYAFVQEKVWVVVVVFHAAFDGLNRFMCRFVDICDIVTNEVECGHGA